MNAGLGVLRSGAVSSVGFSSAATCAAVRAGVTAPTPTRFLDSGGGWIMAHQVLFDDAVRGRTKLSRMASLAIHEAVQGLPKELWSQYPLLLCVAEKERPGRMDGLDDRLIDEISDVLEIRFARHSAIVPRGRVGMAVALAAAHGLIVEGRAPAVMVVAVDSLLGWPTLIHYERERRLLTERNSNGFMPGEGAAALLVGPADGAALVCAGIGFGNEAACIDSELPLRGDGLTAAVKAALAQAGCKMHDIDFRVADLGGEQYYFKEAALALNRTLRVRKEEFELWHPCESTGELGAAAGGMCMAVAHMAAVKGYAPGPRVLLHFGTDKGDRAAIVAHAGKSHG